MDKNELKPHDLEDWLDAYANWVGEHTTEPLAKLSQELRLLADVIARREDQLNKLFEVAHRFERGILVEDVLDSIFKSFAAIIRYDRIGCAFLSVGGTRLTAFGRGPTADCRRFPRAIRGRRKEAVSRSYSGPASPAS